MWVGRLSLLCLADPADRDCFPDFELRHLKPEVGGTRNQQLFHSRRDGAVVEQCDLAIHFADRRTQGLANFEIEGSEGVGVVCDERAGVDDLIFAAERDADTHAVGGEDLLRGDLKWPWAKVAQEDGTPWNQPVGAGAAYSLHFAIA